MHPKGPERPQDTLFWPSTKDICSIRKMTQNVKLYDKESRALVG